MTFMVTPVIIFSSLIFTRLSHPLSMGLILLLQTCLICVSAGLMSQSFWFSYILALIFLGGLLVLFIYVASLASNEPFTFSMMSITFIVLASSLLMIIVSTDMIMLSSKLYIIKSSVATDIFSYSALVGIMYKFPSMTLTLYLVSYLLLTLFAVVKITGNNFGPLRLSTYD